MTTAIFRGFELYEYILVLHEFHVTACDGQNTYDDNSDTDCDSSDNDEIPRQLQVHAVSTRLRYTYSICLLSYVITKKQVIQLSLTDRAKLPVR